MGPPRQPLSPSLLSSSSSSAVRGSATHKKGCLLAVSGWVGNLEGGEGGLGELSADVSAQKSPPKVHLLSALPNELL